MCWMWFATMRRACLRHNGGHQGWYSVGSLHLGRRPTVQPQAQETSLRCPSARVRASLRGRSVFRRGGGCETTPRSFGVGDIRDSARQIIHTSRLFQCFYKAYLHTESNPKAQSRPCLTGHHDCCPKTIQWTPKRNWQDLPAACEAAQDYDIIIMA